MRVSETIFLDPPPPPGHLEKVIQDFQFGLSDLHLLSVSGSFFFLILQPGATVTTDDIAHTREEECGERR